MKVLEQFTNLSQSNYQSGLVEIDAEACTACRQCVRICPASALKLVGKKGVDRRCSMNDVPDCISCGACSAVCESNAITISRFWLIPDGAYKTSAKNQAIGTESYPRVFSGKNSYED